MPGNGCRQRRLDEDSALISVEEQIERFSDDAGQKPHLDHQRPQGWNQKEKEMRENVVAGSHESAVVNW